MRERNTQVKQCLYFAMKKFVFRDNRVMVDSGDKQSLGTTLSGGCNDR